MKKYTISNDQSGIYVVLQTFVGFIIIISAVIHFITAVDNFISALYLLAGLLMVFTASYLQRAVRLEINPVQISVYINNNLKKSVLWRDVDKIIYGLGAERFIIQFTDKNNKILLTLDDWDFTRPYLKNIFQNLKPFAPPHVTIKDYNFYFSKPK